MNFLICFKKYLSIIFNFFEKNLLKNYHLLKKYLNLKSIEKKITFK